MKARTWVYIMVGWIGLMVAFVLIVNLWKC
jgi:hypothetical protein